MTKLRLLASFALAACGSAPHVDPGRPAVVAPEPPPPLPAAEVAMRGGASVVVFDAVERTEVAGPIATTTLALTLRNPADGTGEAQVALRLPDGAVIGRLALEVDGQWMEGEVMPTGAATRFYEDIVRPPVGGRRDPAKLVGLGGRAWALDVFPIPGRGERHVELVYHRLIGAPAGSARVEALPPSLDAGGYAFAAAPVFDRAIAGRAPATVVIALDTSLSVGKAGLADGIAIVRRLLAAHPGARLVTGDVQPRACATAVEDCLAALDAGGGTDLAALLTLAFRQAGAGPAAVVLVSDGRATVGGDPAVVRALVAQQAAAAPTAIHAVAVGQARPQVLARLAAAGQGTAGADLEQALRSPRRPRYDVLGADDVTVADSARGPIVLGRLTTLPSRLEVLRTDDVGAVRASIALAPEVARGFAIARTLGAQLVARAGDDAAQQARAWGIATAQAAMLALETDDDYAQRGIARYKAAERAAEQGAPPPVISDAAKAADRALMVDGDGDGIADRDDACPAEPETWNGKTDEDGCPDVAFVVIEAAEIRILDQVYFEAGRAEIARRAAPLLDEVAAVMRDHPEFSVVAVEGHRDPREPARGGLGLRRAEAVRQALILRGVEAARLVAVDLGDRDPLRPGPTAAERAYNRRVNWRILVVNGDLIEPQGGLLAEEAVALAATGRSSWRLEAAVARGALGRRDQASATAALARARAATRDLGDQLAIFSAEIAAAWPADYLALVRAAALAGVAPTDADADRFYAALTHVELATDPAGPALRAAAERWLAGFADADVRRATAPARLTVTADVLAWLGRADEAARRRTEPAELTDLANVR